MYNILTKSWEPEKLEVETTGKQWMVTPCHTALLVLHHSMTGWVANAYALESAGTVQPLFTQNLDEEELPDEVSSLPYEVCYPLSPNKIPNAHACWNSVFPKEDRAMHTLHDNLQPS